MLFFLDSRILSLRYRYLIDGLLPHYEMVHFLCLYLRKTREDEGYIQSIRMNHKILFQLIHESEKYRYLSKRIISLPSVNQTQAAEW